MKTLPSMDMYILKHSHNSGTDMKILHPRRNPWRLRIPWCYQTCPWIDVLPPMLKTTPILKDEQRTVFKLLLKHEEKNLKLTTKGHQNCPQNSAHQIQIQIWIKPQNSVLTKPSKTAAYLLLQGCWCKPQNCRKTVFFLQNSSLLFADESPLISLAVIPSWFSWS